MYGPQESLQDQEEQSGHEEMSFDGLSCNGYASQPYAQYAQSPQHPGSTGDSDNVSQADAEHEDDEQQPNELADEWFKCYMASQYYTKPTSHPFVAEIPKSTAKFEYPYFSAVDSGNSSYPCPPSSSSANSLMHFLDLVHTDQQMDSIVPIHPPPPHFAGQSPSWLCPTSPYSRGTKEKLPSFASSPCHSLTLPPLFQADTPYPATESIFAQSLHMHTNGHTTAINARDNVATVSNAGPPQTYSECTSASHSQSSWSSRDATWSAATSAFSSSALDQLLASKKPFSLSQPMQACSIGKRRREDLSARISVIAVPYAAAAANIGHAHAERAQVAAPAQPLIE